MLSKEEIISLIGKKQDGEVIGYEYYKTEGYIFPIFKLPENKYDIPTNGGGFYIDEKDKSVKFMTLLEIIELDQPEKPVYF